MKSNLKITCKEASFLINKQQETKISVTEKLKLKMHLLVCDACTLFNKQVNQITGLLKTKHTIVKTLPKNRKQIIKQTLQKEIEKS
jgi:hypothetical protein